MSGADTPLSDASESLRLDKWLWHARFYKTRSLAAKQVAEGKLRVNAVKVSKPARAVRAGDTLTFPLGDHIRVIRINALGTRRGPAPEAQALYTDLDPPAPRSKDDTAIERQGRPDKRDRRRVLQNRWHDLE